jgi:hypothetical protein
LGVDQIEYPGETSTCTVRLTTAKILINSVISTKGERFMVVIKMYGHKSLLSPSGEYRQIWTTGVGT